MEPTPEQLRVSRETGSSVRLKEKSAPAPRNGGRVVADDGTMLVCLIKPGQGASGFYSAKVLERDIPTAFPSGTRMFANHISESESWDRPERSIQDLVATFVDVPYYDKKGLEGEGVYVKVRVAETWRHILEALAPLEIGVSIDAAGLVDLNEQGVPQVTQIFNGRSADFVTKAGAGGMMVALREAARQLPQSQPQPTNPKREEKHIVENESKEPAVNETAITELRESVKTLTESVKTLQGENQALKTERTAHTLREAARKSATEILAEIDMPQPARLRVLESVIEAAPAKDGVLDTSLFKPLVEAAASREVAYAQTAFGYGTGQVSGQGSAAGQHKPAANAATDRVMESVGGARAAIGL